MFPKFTFVLGGAASGKSAFAEQLSVKSKKNLVYLATSQVLDAEMQTRIDRHLIQRGDGWRTVESPLDSASELGKLSAGETCLLDCATMWLSNQMMAERDVLASQALLISAIRECPANLVVVSNEVGQGIVPDNALARQFREAQGRLNIALAAEADLAVLVVAGLPQVLKGELP